MAILPADYRNVLTEVAKAECESRISENAENLDEENLAKNSSEQICTNIKNPAVCLLCNKVVCVLSDCCSEKSKFLVETF